MFICVLIVNHTYGQTPASAVWNLTADQTATVTGSITAPNQELTNMLSTFVSSTQRTCPAASGTWPAETAENATRYIQYSVSPVPGNAFQVATISLSLYAAGGSNLKANVYYSKDSSFATKTQIGSTLILAQSLPSTPNASVATGVSVGAGEALYVRVYPWYTSSASGKYLIAKGVTISGTTNPLVAVLTSANLLTGFSQTSDLPSPSQTYTVSGTNLTSNVTITPPAGFELSADGGSTWSGSASPITLLQNGGGIVGQPVTVSVRLHAANADVYSGDIVHSSAGVADKTIGLTGTRFPAEPTTVSTVSFGAVTGNTMDITFVGGNGSHRIVVMRGANPISWTPADGRAVDGVNSDFALATDHGNGNKVVYDGTGSNVLVSGLTSNLLYNVAVYEYNVGNSNSQNYYTATAGTGSHATLAVSTVTASPSSITFGSGVINKDTLIKTFTLSGDFLTASGGEISLSSNSTLFDISNDGSTFSSNIMMPYTGQTLAPSTVFVRFIPTSAVVSNGSVTIKGGGSSDVLVALTGKGVAAFIETDAPVGFASLGGGTTGGAGGTVMIATTGQQIADVMKLRENRSNAPLIIYVSGTLSDLTTEISVKRTQNVSILGLGTDATFSGFGMKLVEAANIIVRNITFSDCHVDEKDGMAVDQSYNIWVDHCSFTDSPSSDASGKTHDGELDVKNGSYNVTLSYNHFMNHRKTCLLGHTPGQSSDSVLKVTYYRNWFDGTYSRHPRIRFAKVHILNNLYLNTGVVGTDAGGYGVGVTCLAQALVEANYFEGTPKPVLISQINDPEGTLSGDPAGYIKALDNYTINSGALIENLGGYNFDPHDYYNYKPADAALVKSVVMQNAGAGILNISTGLTGESKNFPNTFSLNQNYPNPFNPTTMIQFSVAKPSKVQLRVYNALGKEVSTLVNNQMGTGVHTVTFNAVGLASGVYFYRLVTDEYTETRRMLLLK